MDLSLLRLRLGRASVSRRIRTASYLRKWVVLGALIGVISGLGAAVFFVALEYGTRIFLGVLAGFDPATPLAEGNHPITEAVRPWAIPFVVALGGLIAGIIVFRLAPEAEGHGTDAAIDAFHHRPRGVRSRIPVIKLVASAITIGSGGSGGREGPTAQIGAGFGSFLARTLDLDARDARIAVAAGIGSGIGAIFRAPLGGAILAVEIPYRDDIEADALVPSFVASIIAFSIFGAIVGFNPIFGEQPGGFSDPRQLVYYALIGLAAGLVGRLYIASFYGFTRWFRRWTIPREIRPAIAGFAVGCVGVVLPGALGTGYGWVQAGLSRDTLLHLSIWVVLALPFAKILATSLSIGSGGSGGVFGPGMVIGGLLGAAVWRLLEPVAPAMPLDPGPFVIVAMMALFGSIAHAPIAVMLMVAEMTGNLQMLAPAMIAIGVASLVVGERSIYASQLGTRIESPAHRFQFSLPLLSTIPAGDVARSARLVVSPTDQVGAALARLRALGVPGAPVVTRSGLLRGTVSVGQLTGADGGATVGDLLDGSIPPITADDTLDEALGILADHHADWGPVVREGRLLGVLSMRDAVHAYRQALASSVRNIRALAPGGALVRSQLGAEGPLCGRAVSSVPWPRDVILVAVHRGDRLIVPRGDLVLEPDDALTLFAATSARPALEALLSAPLQDEAVGP